jgi:archaellum biogenesis ATPase FlaH|tara:strand:+ start:2808 stop:4172 length:1365 start_codon:yes stop_codon:yes gene_type:complete
LNSQEHTNFSKYGKSFQEGLAALILQDRAFSDQIQEVLETDYFELKYLQVFVGKIFDYKKEYSVHPTAKILLTILRTGLEEETDAVKKQTRDYFSRIYNTDVRDEDFIKNTSLDFCRKQTLKEAMIKSVGLLKSSSYDEVAKVITDAVKLGSNSDFGYDYVADFEKRFEIKARDPVSTGWDEIDQLCRGGIGNGELGVVIAPTGAGKSMVLVHLGAQALLQGKTVVHYTLELQDTSIGIRYDSCITGVSLSEMHSFKEMIYEKVQEVPGRLIIKEYPTKSASTQTIKNHLEKLKQRDIKVDMILVDYGDLLRPVTVTREKRHDLESIYEELRATAQENKCPVWTASQTNRSGLNAEVVTLEAISEAYSKCFVADFICSVSRTIDDKNNNTGRLFVAKNRFGPDGLVYPAKMDLSRVKIDVLPSTGETIGEIQVNAAKQQSEKLKERYKQFKDGK